MAERNAERLKMHLDQCNTEKQTVERNIELLTCSTICLTETMDNTRTCTILSMLRPGRKTADERERAAIDS